MFYFLPMVRSVEQGLADWNIGMGLCTPKPGKPTVTIGQRLVNAKDSFGKQYIGPMWDIAYDDRPQGWTQEMYVICCGKKQF